MNVDRLASSSTGSATADKGPASAKRYSEIDGIRGWAALSVFLFHLLYELFGAVYPGFRTPVLRAILDGHLAVYVFFVLSGDALSVCFTDQTARGLNSRIVAKRYFRLAGPILFSCLVVYVLMRAGLTFNKEAAPIVQRPDWLGKFLPFEPSFQAMLRYSLIGVFAGHKVSNSYNAFLWPMGIELVGSMLIFCFGIIYRDLRRPATAAFLIALFLAILNSLYALFFLGMWFGIFRSRGLFAQLQENLTLNRIACVVAIVILFGINLDPHQHFAAGIPARIALASAIVFVCYSSADLLVFMRSGLSRFLGWISFPLYFMHFAVIVSWSSWRIVYGASHPDSMFASPAPIILTSFLLSIALATAVAKLEGRYLKSVDTLLTRWLGARTLTANVL